MQIKYGIQIILSEQHLAFDDTDTDEAGEAEVTEARWRAFWEDQIEKQNQQTFIYTFYLCSERKCSSVPLHF